MSGGSYYVPANSRWPILGSLALGAMMAGIGIKLVYNTGAPLLVIGLLSVICVMGMNSVTHWKKSQSVKLEL